MLEQFSLGTGRLALRQSGRLQHRAHRQARRAGRAAHRTARRRLALSSGAARVRGLRPRRQQSVGARLRRARPAFHDALPQLLGHAAARLTSFRAAISGIRRTRTTRRSSSPIRRRISPSFRNYLLASARYDHGAGGAGKPGSDAIYGGHSHVGTMIYLGDNWPDEYRGHLFTHNLDGHQINQQINKPRRLGLRHRPRRARPVLLHRSEIRRRRSAIRPGRRGLHHRLV